MGRLVGGNRGIDGGRFGGGSVAGSGRVSGRPAVRLLPLLLQSAVPVAPGDQVQAQAGDRGRALLRDLPGTVSDRHDGDPLRRVDALLTAGAADVDAPLVHPQRFGGQGGDRVDQVEHVRKLGPDHGADVAHRVERPRRGLQVYHREHPGPRMLAQRLPCLVDGDCELPGASLTSAAVAPTTRTRSVSTWPNMPVFTVTHRDRRGPGRC